MFRSSLFLFCRSFFGFVLIALSCSLSEQRSAVHHFHSKCLPLAHRASKSFHLLIVPVREFLSFSLCLLINVRFAGFLTIAVFFYTGLGTHHLRYAAILYAYQHIDYTIVSELGYTCPVHATHTLEG